MIRLRNLAVGAIVGAVLGSLFLGLGGRIVMRTLAIAIAREPASSFAGTLEVVAYGAIVGMISGAAFSLARPILPERRWIVGTLLAAITYAGTLLTLPAHIAETAQPFAGMMLLVHALFGLCFLLFGLAMACVSYRGSNPAPAAAPASPPE